MGYVDSDAHVMENDRTWEYIDPGEREYAPKKVDGVWEVDNVALDRGPFNADTRPAKYHELFPRGSVDLTDASARVRRMDELGVDVQVIFSSWWLPTDISSPVVEAALARSWNRWMAEGTADSGGRLRWALQAPVRIPERAIEEMKFGKEHGAVGVHMRGVRHGLGVAHPCNIPIYEAAQDLDLVIAVHTGGDQRVMREEKELVFLNNFAPVPGAFFSIIKAGLPQRFPRLRWAFAEAGASWLPFAIQESFRSTSDASSAGGYRNFKDWRSNIGGLLANLNFYVACQVDDDIPYLSEFIGGTHNLVHGTDYGHLDGGSDPYGLKIIDERSDMEATARRRIVDGNGRKLWNIDPTFTPAPPPAEYDVSTLEPIPDWLVGYKRV